MDEEVSEAKGISKREILTGHTALCLMSLLGFVLYTATYSVVYVVKTDNKPVAVIEMWMILTHLFSSILTCVMRALTLSMDISHTSPIAEAQSAVFLAIALALTGVGTACMQDEAFCTIYYPAAALPPLAASGSIAWSWVMYVASFGCQNPSSTLSLGIGERDAITAASLMGLLAPQVLNTLSTVCDTPKWKLYCSQGAACNTPLNILLIFTAWLLTHAGHLIIAVIFKNRQKFIGRVLQLVGVIFLWIDIFAVLSVGKSGKGMGVFVWSMGILTVFPLITLLGNLFSQTLSSVRGGRRAPILQPPPFTGIHFPLLNLYNLKGNDEHHLL